MSASPIQICISKKADSTATVKNLIGRIRGGGRLKTITK
jgi:hypothetical protein